MILADVAGGDFRDPFMQFFEVFGVLIVLVGIFAITLEAQAWLKLR